MRGAGFVTKRNSDRVLLFMNNFIYMFIILALCVCGPRGTEARTVSHRLLYRKVAFMFHVFFQKSRNPHPS